MDLILTVVAEDRPGVVEVVAGAVAAHGGNWSQAQLATLAGHFVGIAAVHVEDGSVEALQDALQSLPGVDVRVSHGREHTDPAHRHTFSIVANDRPGIVAEVSTALARAGVNVVELSTATEPASMSGGDLFRAEVMVGLTADQPVSEVVRALEALSPDLMIDPLDG